MLVHVADVCVPAADVPAGVAAATAVVVGAAVDAVDAAAAVAAAEGNGEIEAEGKHVDAGEAAVAVGEGADSRASQAARPAMLEAAAAAANIRPECTGPGWEHDEAAAAALAAADVAVAVEAAAERPAVALRERGRHCCRTC